MKSRDNLQPSPSQRPSRVKKRRARRCISHLLNNCHQQKRETQHLVRGGEGGRFHRYCGWRMPKRASRVGFFSPSSGCAKESYWAHLPLPVIICPLPFTSFALLPASTLHSLLPIAYCLFIAPPVFFYHSFAHSFYSTTYIRILTQASSSLMYSVRSSAAD